MSCKNAERFQTRGPRYLLEAVLNAEIKQTSKIEIQCNLEVLNRGSPVKTSKLHFISIYEVCISIYLFI